MEQRRENFNTWGYMQSYGLGYYEYFCLCEEIGALPLPVVHAGLLCQVRSAKEAPIPMAELEAYVQDVLDLIDLVKKRVFENSGVTLEPEVRILGRD